MTLNCIVLSVPIVPGRDIKAGGALPSQAVHCTNLWYLCQKQNRGVCLGFLFLGIRG